MSPFQVDVLINGIPCSCEGKNCYFNFEEELTPVVDSISPTRGQGGTIVTIQGSGFKEDMTQISVIIGSAPCKVTSSDESTIECVASRHEAGSYEVIVSIGGAGRAFVDLDVPCFTYLLTLSSVSPESGGISAGYLINITGEGFLDFASIPATKSGKRIPTFRHSLGFPSTDYLQGLNICPSARSLYEDYMRVADCLSRQRRERFKWRNRSKGSYKDAICSLCPPDGDCEDRLLQMLDVHVSIGGTPCIITKSTIDYVICMHTLSPAAQTDISVSVFNETSSLSDAFTAETEQTPVVTSVSDLYGPVTGGTVLTITGRGFTSTFNSDVNVSVAIGRVRCDVNFANATHIVCITGPHPPGFVRISVSTASGVALREEVLDELDPTNESVVLFPTFEHRLFAEVSGEPSGSVTGGTPVVIKGGLFVEGKTQVYVGDKQAEILSIHDENVTILTPTNVATKVVNLTLNAGLLYYYIQWNL